jgi:hypothetical protein
MQLPSRARSSNTTLVTLIAFASALAHASATHAQTNTIVISGKVVSAQDGRALTGASVELNGRVRHTTTNEGTFRFVDAPAGPAIIYVRALGYEDLEIKLRLERDTVLELRLREAPILLGQIDAVSRVITIRGRVIDPITQMGLDAIVYASPGKRKDDTSGAGRYRIPKVPATDSTSVYVEAFGYLPQRKFTSATADTIVDFELAVDPIVAARIAKIAADIDARADRLPYEVQTIRNKDIYQAGTLKEVLEFHYHITSWKCLMIDDVQDRRAIALLLPDDIEVLEIIDRGHGTKYKYAEMVRIYTKDFFRKRIVSDKPLRDIVVSRGGNPMQCR